MKVKFILQASHQQLEEFEEEVADFLNDSSREIVDIKYFVNRDEKMHLVFTYLSVMILYKDKP